MTPTPSSNAFTVGWILLKDDMDYLCRAIERAAGYGVDHLQLSHEIIHHADQLFSREGLADKIRALARLGHAHRMRVYIWTHELRRVPSCFVRNGKVQLDESQLWRWLEDRYEEVFRLIPEIDGLVLTFHETDVSVYDDGKVVSRLDKPQRVARLINTINRVCRKHRKELIVRTFVYWPGELADVVKGIDAADPDVAVMSKEVPHDWQPNYPDNPAIGAFPHRRQIIEFDLGHEYYGQNLVPYLVPAYLKRRLAYQRGKGAAGAAARISRDGHSALGTAGELNLAAFQRFCRDPDADEQATWQAVVAERYGQAVADELADLLRRTPDVVERTLLTQDFYFLNDHSRVPGLDYAERHIATHSIAKWIPTPEQRRREQALAEPTIDVYRAVLAEKDQAVALAERLLEELRGLASRMKSSDFDPLRAELTRLRDLARLYRIVADAYFAYQVHRRHPDQITRSAVEKKLAQMQAEADRLERTCPGDFLLDADRLRHLARQIHERLVGSDKQGSLPDDER